MPDYRRYLVPGGTYFLTVVTLNRTEILITQLGRDSLGSALRQAQRRWPFEVVAVVLLPDHFHTVWSLPRGDCRYSLRLSRVKERFTELWLRGGGGEQIVSRSRERKRERGVWQRRFYEHMCRDEEDLRGCVDYVHWNPKKHGLVERVRDWRWSSFHRFVRTGEYSIDWGGENPCVNTDTFEPSEP